MAPGSYYVVAHVVPDAPGHRWGIQYSPAMEYPHRRARFRIEYPKRERPTLTMGDEVFEIVLNSLGELEISLRDFSVTSLDHSNSCNKFL